MAPPKGKGAAARSNPAVPPAVHDLSEDPESHEHLESLDDDNGASHTPPSPDLEAELARLREALVAAQDLIATLQQTNPVAPPGASVPPPIASGPSPVAVAPAAEPKVNKPTEFSGKLSEYSTFISQCLLTFTMCPNTYNTDERKVLFVVSLLRGSALSWAREIAENENHLLRNDYTAFKTAMSNVYLDQNYKELCQTKLDSLQQTRSAASYAVEFATLAAALTLNDEAKCLNFYRGLGQDVKDGMAIIGRASTYDALVKQAISIDQRSHQRRLESKSESNNQNKSRFSGNT